MFSFLDSNFWRETVLKVEDPLCSSFKDFVSDSDKAVQPAAPGLPQDLLGSPSLKTFSRSPWKKSDWIDQLQKYGETHPDFVATGEALLLGFFSYAYLPYKIGSELCSSETPACLYRGAMNFLEDMIPTGLREVFKAPPRPRELRRLEIDEEKINSMITEALSKGNSMVKDIRVRLLDGEIHVTGKASLGLFDADLKARIRFGVKDGKTQGAVEELTVGGADLPKSLTNYLLQQLKSQGIHVPKEPALDDLSWLEINDVKNLEIQEGKIILEQEVPI